MKQVILATKSAETSNPFVLSGPIRFRADDLGDNEWVALLEERVDGTYEPMKDNGQPIILTKIRPSINIESYGNHKAEKSETLAVVGVGYAE